MNNKNNSRKAFTLIEISIVFLIAAFLTVIVLGSKERIDSAKIKSAKIYTRNAPVVSVGENNRSLVLWLDAVSEGYIEKDASNKVSKWKDIGWNKYHFSQAVSSSQPSYVNDAINNLPGIMFDGTDDNLTTSFVDINNSTIIIVYKLSSIAPPFYLFDGINEPERHALWNLGMFSGLGSYNAPVWDLSPQIITASFNGANSVLYYGGVQIGPNNTGSNILSGITLGARAGGIEALEGYIGELIVYNRVLDNNERQIIERYLSQKWKINIAN